MRWLKMAFPTFTLSWNGRERVNTRHPFVALPGSLLVALWAWWPYLVAGYIVSRFI